MKFDFRLLSIFLLFTTVVIGQEFSISGELRPRLEVRHGYKTLASPDDEAAVFVSQRTRLNTDYFTDKFRVKLSIQNIRVWGDVSTLSINDKNGLAFHEAYAEYYFSPKFSMKLGRQEIAYDDQRMFGSVGWAQQARSHDAFLLKIKTGKTGKLDFGFAFNANQESLFKENYEVDQYKTLQYAWYHTDLNEAMNLSFLFLNNGMPYDETEQVDNTDEKIAFSQTLGGRFVFKKNRINVDAAGYFQTGSTPNAAKNDQVDLSAYYFTANAKFNIINEFSAGLGIEYLSGNDQGSNNSTNNAFNPFYGTNHKFNGWMDYFYVGNHINSVGLIDFNIPLNYKKDKFSAGLIPHFFSADGTILNTDGSTAESYLGTEIDFTVGYTLIKSVTMSLGYSQMFATDSMELLKGGSADETNNWAWLMITFKPNFFTKKFEKKN